MTEGSAAWLLLITGTVAPEALDINSGIGCNHRNGGFCQQIRRDVWTCDAVEAVQHESAAVNR